jgi:hypothetical protein
MRDFLSDEARILENYLYTIYPLICDQPPLLDFFKLDVPMEKKIPIVNLEIIFYRFLMFRAFFNILIAGPQKSFCLNKCTYCEKA